ncbi:hypothetical protein [Streptomyces sp. NPDC093111]|uniref:hypothetical protein n=1 Tax=Streptomyces sp. NPDC093111 TaxID=3154978 RepID=UPI00341B992A
MTVVNGQVLRVGRRPLSAVGVLLVALVKGADPLVEGGVLQMDWLDEPKLRTGVNRN